MDTNFSQIVTTYNSLIIPGEAPPVLYLNHITTAHYGHAGDCMYVVILGIMTAYERIRYKLWPVGKRIRSTKKNRLHGGTGYICVQNIVQCMRLRVKR